MAEFFLAPAFLWGAAAAAAPILIHLLARQRYRRVQWAAMEFLRRAMKRTQRRQRLQRSWSKMTAPSGRSSRWSSSA